MSSSRVLSIRFTEDEYQALQALSVITGDAINAIVREAVSEKALRSVDDAEFQAKAVDAKRRVQEADDVLRARVLAAAGTTSR